MFFGTLLNSLAIVTFYAVPRLQTPVNILIMGCVGIDVGMIVIGYPFIIVPCFRGLWDFGDVWCNIWFLYDRSCRVKYFYTYGDSS